MMNAVERVVEYSDTIPQERPHDNPNTAPPPDWPQTGRIELRHATFSYREGMAPVLNNLSLVIEGGARLVVVVVP